MSHAEQATERTHLLVNETVLQDAPQQINVYDRFSSKQKRTITSIISLAGFIGPFAAGCFVPCIPEVAKDLNTTGTVINYTVGGYIFMIGLGNLFWAPYASYYGRQPVYLASLPLAVIGSSISAAAQTVAHLVIGRVILALGCSCVMAVGAATISDIYALEERGTAMGIFLGTLLLGPPIAPTLGGFIATYASWRVMQLLLAILALIAYILVATLLHETSHPGTRGVDKALAKEGRMKRRYRLKLLNPLGPLDLLRGPPIASVSLTGSLAYFNYLLLMVPMSYTLGPAYNMDTPALIGACFIPSGIGNIFGAVLSGKLADIAVIRGRAKRDGKWVPEDRLVATIPGALALIPIPLLIFGITTAFIPGKIGLIINLICLFFHGMGTDTVLAPSNTYLVDVLPSRGAEAMAVSSALRNIISAFASAGALPLIEQFGVFPTYCFAAVLSWLGCIITVMTIRYGDMLRSWVDIGYVAIP
ncbi:hypothetical protein M422DRAFT_784388 [Sphaerobolus stellatus SS14]|uniref:Major facilitator superfamily (MFS) profile domain-containing protein n=1 Tax=Sphaerobolus stellatus (strain SS14) TaxID=990650 RepID=A0A0C9TI08_SPHS4|nr:hypothetical protein M422DRAFT_784388 [Sphaerobolus stellatus SS14]